MGPEKFVARKIFCLGELAALADGDGVCPFVHFVSAMAFDEAETNGVDCHQVVKFLPQILIGDRLPAISKPARGDPTRQISAVVSNVSAVRLDFYGTWIAQGFQAVNDGGELHTIVCRALRRAGENLFFPCALQNSAPSTRTGVA